MGVDVRQARVYDSKRLYVQKTCITFVTVTVPAPNVLAADVFRTGIFH